MTAATPTPADRHAKDQLAGLIAYAESSEQTLLAALLSEAADVLDGRIFMLNAGDG